MHGQSIPFLVTITTLSGHFGLHGRPNESIVTLLGCCPPKKRAQKGSSTVVTKGPAGIDEVTGISATWRQVPAGEEGERSRSLLPSLISDLGKGKQVRAKPSSCSKKLILIPE
jgi:hypothetical protein